MTHLALHICYCQ